MVDLAASVFRDFVTDGVPSSGTNKPRKHDVRQWGAYLESLANLSFTNGKVYATKAAMDADLVPAANTSAIVSGNGANDGLYMKVGATGVGSWTRLLDFVPGAQIVHAVDAGAGTPNAIVATTSIGLSASGSQIVRLDVFETNTASPVTVAFNGGSALTIKTAAGNDVVVGGLTAGPVLGTVSGSTFRLLSDQASAAIVAAAELAETGALAAQAAAESAAGASLTNATSRAAAMARTFPAAVEHIITGGFAEPDDGGGAQYSEIPLVTTEQPWHMLTNGGTRRWNIAEKVVTPFMFGAVGNGIADDGAALNNFFAFGAAVRVVMNTEGNFASSVPIIAGSSAGVPLSKDYRGSMKVTALAAIPVLVTLYNLTFCVWDGKVEAIGTGSSTFSARTCDVGVLALSCGRMKIGAILGQNFRFGGFVTDHVTNNTGMEIGHIRASACGSGAADASSLTANWSSPVNSGTSNSNGQLTTLDVTTTVPTWATDRIVPVGVFINDKFYIVQSSTATTISIGPWLEPDDVTAGSGTLRYVIGAGCNISGSDGNALEIGLVNTDNCGIGYRNSSLYGSVVGQIIAQANGIGVWLGLNYNNSHIGYNIGNIYTETNTINLLYMPSGANYGFIGSTNEDFSFAKVLPFDRARTTGQTGQPRAALDRLMFGSWKGDPLFFEKANTHTASEIARALLRNTPHHEYVYVSNTLNVTLPVLDDDIDQLFGYNARSVTLIGTGTDGAPTGTITWTAPGGQTVNGGASVAYSGFARSPARFVMRYERTTSNWVVYCTTPRRLEATATVDPASLAPGQRTATATIAVAGAALGDIVKASFSLNIAPLIQVAWVSATDTVSYYFENPQALLAGSATYDAPSIAAGAEVTTTVTVTGAAVGDVVVGMSHGVDQAGLTIDGYVSAANTVTAVVRNGTAGAVDLASATLRAAVLPVTATDIGSGTLKVRVEK
ncbi:MAG: hypothetical protein EOR00_09185 [Mesorhizobium sp.]|uniref:hypothetical protein n=1 Tax=Mesorhizobium sp. TaxID=1871066 RepID=UPI000FE66560|nr:hypothetical protein [Mesorhizobium sp.]RWP19270.1 MAG: hypothetical protein EOR00_09185 [Mesorhizobium sp.]